MRILPKIEEIEISDLQFVLRPMAASPCANLMVLVLLHGLLGAAASCYTSAFSFGDSLTDTGNLFAFSHGGPANAIGWHPYGMTYFRQPTGRFSDGRLIVDFIAQALGLPFLRPYLAGGSAERFIRGANFAVGGATALNSSFYRAKGIDVYWPECSLDVQVQMFRKLLAEISGSTSDSSFLSNSLILMGEIGGNDYNHQFLRRQKFEKIRTLVPDVIQAISSAIKTLIELGAKTLVVPGNLPIGCVPIYLKMFESQNPEDYDSETGCLKWMNEFAMQHNRLLQDELNRLSELHSNVTIAYADYYGATLQIFQNPQQFGIKTPLSACCGGGGTYNCNVGCGEPSSTVCSDPSSYISWDGLHLTEAAYEAIAHSLLEGRHAIPSLIQTCANLQSSSALDSSSILEDIVKEQTKFYPLSNSHEGATDIFWQQ